MQNNVSDLSQKLQRSLDNNYNVIDMPAVVEIISTLEKTAVTKELLETTRLGKYINELRRRTTNESLAKRAKELVKKWRDLILPDANGQLKAQPEPDTGQSRLRKRRADGTPVKKALFNGQARDMDLSDNSNCSLKEVRKTDVIFINSDSNSSIPEQVAPKSPVEAPTPKKRGRKKGSKNHRNLVVAAEQSFSNKMAVVSRNAKVKTTQELLADLQNKSGGPKPQNMELRAARLTETLTKIDQKLNPARKGPRTAPPAVTVVSDDEDVVIVVDDPELPPEGPVESPLTLEAILAKLPPVDRSEPPDPDFPECQCPDDAEDASDAPERLCPVLDYLCDRYGLGTTDLASRVDRLHKEYLPNVNGNWGRRSDDLINSQYPLDDTTLLGSVTNVIETNIARNCTQNSDPQTTNLLSDNPESLDSSEKNTQIVENHQDSMDLDLKSTSLLNLGPKGVRSRNCTDTTENQQDLGSDVIDLGVEGARNRLKMEPEPTECSAAGPAPHLCDCVVPDLSKERLPKSLSLESFNKYSISEVGGACCEFREWHETLDMPSHNQETLRILPYVVID